MKLFLHEEASGKEIGRFESDREPEPGAIAILPENVYLLVRKWKIGTESPQMGPPEVSFYGKRLDGANGVVAGLRHVPEGGLRPRDPWPRPCPHRRTRGQPGVLANHEV